MPINHSYPPEGLRPPVSCTLSELRDAMESGAILEGTVQRCDTAHALHIPLGGGDGIMPREEAVAPWISGAYRDISLLSRVGKQTCFMVTDIRAD